MAEQYVLRTSDGREFPIDGIIHIGREQSNGIAIDDTAISRHHASVWVENGKLQVADNKSANGVYVNNALIPNTKPKVLRNGDRIRIGQTDFVVAMAQQSADGTVILQPVAAKSSSRLPLIACSVLGLMGITLLVAVPVIGFLFLDWNLIALNLPTGQSPLAQVTTPAPFTLTPPPTVVNVNVSVLKEFTPEMVEPGRVAAESEDLASAVASLNRSQLEFVHLASSVTGFSPAGKFLFAPVAFGPQMAELDDLLAQVGADALKVALLADKFSFTMGAQDGGSETAGQIASNFTSVAQVSAALVIDAQDLRTKLLGGEVTPAQAAQVIAEYGGRLWFPVTTDTVTDSNPFIPLLDNPSLIPAPITINTQDLNNLFVAGTGAPAELPFWLASSGTTETKTLIIPPSKVPPVDRNDPAVLSKLTTAAGQKSEPDAARQVASAIIGAGGGVDISSDQSTGGEVVAAFSSTTAVSSPSTDSPTTPPRTLPAIPGGNAVTIIPPSNSPNPVTTLFGIDNNGAPTATGQLEVTETTPIVSLTISNLVIKQINKRPKDAFNTFEADVIYEFDVAWSTNLVSPQFSLDCVSGNHFDITSTGGTLHISAKGLLILYPGAEDAYCYASRNGNTLGSASIHFLVGDAAEATQRANQVETDSVSLDLTLTADSLGTQSAVKTNAAATLGSAATSNAVGTEVAGSQTAEFPMTGTAFAIKQTEFFGLTATESARQFLQEGTATHAALLTERAKPEPAYSFGHPGNVFGTATKPLINGHRYNICLAGLVHLVNPDRSVGPDQIMHVNGIKVSGSGCVQVTGTGAVASITCGEGEPAENPGGYSVTVTDLGP